MLLTVILVMLLLGVVGAWVAGSLGRQHASVALGQFEYQTAYAALSGLQWARQRTRDGSCAASSVLSFADVVTTVECTAFTVIEGADVYQVFHLSAEARFGTYGTSDFARRMATDRVVVR